MQNLTVAHTILEQLGGSRFIAMTGAKHFLGTERELQFALPRSALALDGINVVVIRLDPSDTYTVRFLRMGRGSRVKTIKEVSGVYADMLVNLFESTTGLRTVL